MPITMQMLHVQKLRAPAGPIPGGLQAVALGSGAFERGALTPVLTVGGYRVWPFSYHDNRCSLGLVLYDSGWQVVGQVEKRGARYIYKITHDDAAGEITFWGQAAENVVMSLAELEALLGEHAVVAEGVAAYELAPPSARRWARGPQPAYEPWDSTPALDGILPIRMEKLKVTQVERPPAPLPPGLYAAVPSPVVEIAGYTLWPCTYGDNRVSFGMVMYDPEGRIRGQSERPGARYIAAIELDPQAETITFRGQADQTVVMRPEDVAVLMV